MFTATFDHTFSSDAEGASCVDYEQPTKPDNNSRAKYRNSVFICSPNGRRHGERTKDFPPEKTRKPFARAIHGSPILCSDGTSSRIASGAKSAPLGQQTVLHTGSSLNFANMCGSSNDSNIGPVSSGRRSTVAWQPSLNVTESECGPASSALSM